MSSCSSNTPTPNIDMDLWPDLELTIFEYDWREHLGDFEAREYITALDSLKTAEQNGSDAILSGSRSFTLSFPCFDNLTRLDWIAPTGRTFAISFEKDLKLCNLAKREPLKAVREISKRFSLALSRQEFPEWPLLNEMHALALRDLIIHGYGREKPILWSDPWTGRFKLECKGPSASIKSDFGGTPLFFLKPGMLDGPRTNHQLCIEPFHIFCDVPLHHGWRFYSQAVLQRLAAEVNTVLAAADLPLIPKAAIAQRMWDSNYVPSNILYKRFCADPKSEIPNFFDFELYPHEPLDETDEEARNAANVIRDLETAERVHDGVVETKDAAYKIFSDDDGYYHTLLKLIDGKPRPQYDSDDIDLGLEGLIEDLDSSDTALEFFRGLNRRRITDAQLPSVIQQKNLLVIISQAVNELALARQVETDEPDSIYLITYVKYHLGGVIEIAMGEDGWIKTGTFINAVKPLFADCLGIDFSGPFTWAGDCVEPGCGLTAIEHRAAAEETLRHLGLTDLTSLTAAIDEHYEFETDQHDPSLSVVR